MAVQLLPIALSLAAKFLPEMLGSLMGPKAEQTAEKVIEIGKTATGVSDPQDIETALEQNPQALVDFKAKVMEFQLAMYQEDTKRLETVNTTMRAELNSKDPYNARWRATWGYTSAFVWFLQFFAFVFVAIYAVIAYPARVGEIIKALGEFFASTAWLWSVALAVLGVAVHKRSKDKELAAGHAPAAGLIDSLIDKIKGG